VVVGHATAPGVGDFFDGGNRGRAWKNWFDHLDVMTLLGAGVGTSCEFGGHVTLQHPGSSGLVWSCEFLVSTSEAASVTGVQWVNKVSTP